MEMEGKMECHHDHDDDRICLHKYNKYSKPDLRDA